MIPIRKFDLDKVMAIKRRAQSIRGEELRQLLIELKEEGKVATESEKGVMKTWKAFR